MTYNYTYIEEDNYCNIETFKMTKSNHTLLCYMCAERKKSG